MATYSTQIQWGGAQAPWHDDADLTITVKNRKDVVLDGPPATGTTVTWSGPNGSGTITFFDDRSFQGTAQFPSEGPVGYRGQFKS